MLRPFSAFIALLIAPAAFAQKTPAPRSAYLRAPAGKQYARVVPGGTTVLPNGRFLTPLGKRLYTGPNLWNVALSPDGKLLAGLSDTGVVFYRVPQGERERPRILATKDLYPAGVFDRAGRRFFVSTGEEGGVAVYEVAALTDGPTGDAPPPAKFVPLNVAPVQTLSANSADFAASYINDLALSPDEKHLYGVDVAHQRVVVWDVATGKIAASVGAGRQPYALALSDDGKRLFVANIGLFDYALVPPAAPQKNPKQKGLTRPAFGFPSPESERGTRFEGRDVPGLGSARTPDAQSLWAYDLSNPGRPRHVQTAKSGLLIHAPSDRGKSVGGSAPNKILVRGKALWVTNANSDTVQRFHADTLRLEQTIKLTPSPLVRGLRGVIPSGMAMSRRDDRLYVSESGLNAVAVLDPVRGKVLGHVPTGWFPNPLALSPDDATLYIGTQKGIGRGPSGAKHERPATDERAGLSPMPGMIDAVPTLKDYQLARTTARVLANNGMTDRTKEARSLPRGPIPLVHGKPSDKIEYVVFITKENHTFDGVFGDLPGARGEPDYAEWGQNGWVQEQGREKRVPIMPNHVKLAKQFAVSDNFYMEPQASGDGHRWLVGVYPSLWTTRVFYSGWNFRADDKAKGRLISFGSNGSQMPEDYLENGSLWEHLGRGGIPFRNYGEGFEFPGVDEGEPQSRTGAGEVVNFPMPQILFQNTCFEFPIFNMNIPDIARVDWFKQDVAKYRKAHGGRLPRFMNVALCNDHGDNPSPYQKAHGYPFVSSFMADNDLALGQMVEYLSHLPEWKKMAIFVTEDDSGGDGDHIDRHRSFVLCISPYARRGYISREHTSIMSILKTIYLVFGLGPNNQFDALATDLGDMFTLRPDFTPYRHVPPTLSVFNPALTLDPNDPTFEKRRQMPSVALDDPDFVERLRRRGDKPPAANPPER